MKTIAAIMAGRRAHVPTRDTVEYPKLWTTTGWLTQDRRPLIKPTPANLRMFGKTTYARRAMNRIKDPIANLGWEIVPRKGVAMNSLLQEQIAVATNCIGHPNETDNFRSLLEQILNDMMINGAGCYEQQLGGDAYHPLWLWPTDSLAIQINPRWKGNDAEPRYYQSLGYGNIGGVQGVSLKNSEIVYLKQNPSTETPFGLGELEVAFAAVNRKLGVSDYSGKLASNAQPANIVTFPGMSNEQLLTIRQWWRNDVEGQGQQPFIAPPIGSKAEMISLRATDDTSLFLNYQEVLVQEIATAFNIDAMSLNVHHTVNRACYSDDTETLTDHGWKKLDELSADSIVASYNPTTGGVEFRKPKEFLVFDYTGSMIHLTGHLTDVLVTPDHRMFVDRDIVLAASLENRASFTVIVGNDIDGGLNFETVHMGCDDNVRRVPYSGRVYCFAVPPHKLFVTRRNGKIAVHGNTAAIIDAADWRNAVVPKATLIEAYITHYTLLKKLGYSQLQFRFVDLKRDDELLEAQIYEIEFANGATTPNEYRQSQNKEPIQGRWGELTGIDVEIAKAAARGAAQVNDPDLPAAKPVKKATKAVADRAAREQPEPAPTRKSKPKRKEE